MFFRQNQDRQVEPGESDELPSTSHSSSPTAAEKDVLVTFSNICRKLLHFYIVYVTS